MKKIIDPKLQNFIDLLGEEYKDMLFQELIQQSDTLDEMSISKLVSIDSDIKKYVRRKRETKRFKTFQLMGMLYLCIGVLILIGSEFIQNYQDLSYLTIPDIVQLMALVLSLIGMIVLILPMFFVLNPSHLSKDHSERTKLQEYKVIMLWRELEGLCTDLSTRSKVITSRTAIELLSSEQLINEKEAQDLLQFLRIRNEIVHNSKHKSTEDEINCSLKNAERILLKLYKKILPHKKQ